MNFGENIGRKGDMSSAQSSPPHTSHTEVLALQVEIEPRIETLEKCSPTHAPFVDRSVVMGDRKSEVRLKHFIPSQGQSSAVNDNKGNDFFAHVK